LSMKVVGFASAIRASGRLRGARIHTARGTYPGAST
jgi:hypothetical protein